MRNFWQSLRAVALVLLFVAAILAVNVLTARATGGRAGSVIAEGDSMYESVPWGSLAFVVPIGLRDGDLVVADTSKGIVIKRLSNGSLISENPNGLTFAPGKFELRSKVWLVVYCPLIRPKESGPAQIAQGAATERKMWAGAAEREKPLNKPVLHAGKMVGLLLFEAEARIMGRDLWISNRNLGDCGATHVLVRGSLVDVRMVRFEPPGLLAQKNQGTTVIAVEQSVKDGDRVTVRLYKAEDVMGLTSAVK